MKKEQLTTGDIIVNRGGYIGVVIKNEGDDYILYQTIGSDPLDDINDDLTFDEVDYSEGDIMEVHRGVTFYDIDHGDGNLVWQREFGWNRPTEEERKAREERKELERQKWLEETRKQAEKRRTNLISIVSQDFHGNRTATEIRKEDADRFILGYMNDSLTVSEPIDRTVIRVPDTDGVVFICNKYAEEKRLADCKKWFEKKGRVIEPLAEIPEMDIRIYSRCIACRMSLEGELESLKDEDYEVVMKYFAE